MHTSIPPNPPHGARLHALLRVDKISESSEVTILSRGNPSYRPTLLDLMTGYRKTPNYVNELKDYPASWAINTTGKIYLHSGWEGAPEKTFGLDDRKVRLSVKRKDDVWLDEESRPMMGYVDSGFGNESLGSNEPVLVALELPPAVADSFCAYVDGVIARPNTKLFLTMNWRFTSSYKNQNGEGSGTPLWYPISFSLYRETASAAV
jgi:hypothetical protein